MRKDSENRANKKNALITCLLYTSGSMPDPTMIDRIEEPYIRASVITTTAYIGPIMTLCPVSYTHLKRGIDWNVIKRGVGT